MPEHPAKFTPVILKVIGDALSDEACRLGHEVQVLDPFAGTGLIHDLAKPGLIDTYGIEIEPEWAEMHPATEVGDATDMAFESLSFDAIATSPCYGNRMADHHEAKDDSKRITYRHRLGRALSENSAGKIHWGVKYEEFHEKAWTEADRVLRPGGLFVLNAKNFHRTRTVKKKRVQEVVDVVGWHHDYLTSLGYATEADIAVPVRGMGYGQNGKKRIGHERVIVMRKRSAPGHPGLLGLHHRVDTQ